jgi:two-component system sensor histidine kinase VicK
VARDLRREREVERMKTEFLSRVGHELRTPLTGIIGYSEILLARPVDKQRQRLWSEEILAASKRLLRIVEMLEFVAATGAGRVPLRPEPVDVRRVIDDVTTRWSARLDGHHSVTRRVARRLPPVVADQRWLTLTIDELIDNAVKFSPEGGRVTVTAAPAEDRAIKGVEISVIDRGQGMTLTEQEAAFGDFVQGDPSDTRRFGGLGLGLGLVKRVVEGHGGSVMCESEPNRGSRFTIFLPASDEARG